MPIALMENNKIITFAVIFTACAISTLLLISDYRIFWAVLIVITSLILVVIKPKAFLYAAISLLTMRDLIAGGERFAVGSYFNFDLGGLINILTIFLGAIYLVIHRKTPFCNMLAKSYVLFLVFCAISLTYTTDFISGLKFFARLTSPFVFYLIAVHEIETDRDIGIVIRCIIFSSAIPIILGLYQIVTGHGNLDSGGFFRVYGSFGHPNTFSFYLLFVFCITYTLCLSPWVKQRILFFVLSFVIAFLLLFTYCRIAWIAFAVIFLFLNHRYHQKKIVIATLIFIIFVFAYFLPSIHSRLGGAIEIFKKHDILNTNVSIGWRINAWRHLLLRIPEHPFIGHGLRGVFFMMQDLYDIQSSPHNGYLGILYDTGVIGLSFFLFVLAMIIRNGREVIEKIKDGLPFDRASIFVSCLIGFVIILISDNLLEYYNVSLYFWIIFAMGGNAANNLKRGRYA